MALRVDRTATGLATGQARWPRRAFPVPIGLALPLNSMLSQRLKRLVQSVLYLPHFLSWVIVVAIFQEMLGGSGMPNDWLRSHGHSIVQIIGNPGLFKALLTTQLWYITLPSLKSIIILLFILRLGNILSVGFEQIILQQGPVGLNASEVLDTYVYHNGVLEGRRGVAAAVGLVKGLVGVALVLGANKVAHLLGEEGLYQCVRSWHDVRNPDRVPVHAAAAGAAAARSWCLAAVPARPGPGGVAAG